MDNLGNKQVMAKNIRRYMEQNHVTQTDVCGTLGIPMPTLSDWINAKTYPRIDKIEMLANYFGITKANLVEEKASLPKDEQIDEPEIRAIQRAAKGMTQGDKQRMLAMLQLAFEEAFKDDEGGKS